MGCRNILVPDREVHMALKVLLLSVEKCLMLSQRTKKEKRKKRNPPITTPPPKLVTPGLI